ncbi:aspartate aminotransferase [Rhodococcus sp. 05-2255-3B1]|uniref:aminotransferase-like domain-containing protein n=1 Tax=unclassified Rhodococcus (in: high G+C Gram-positive bacteria) TaxID=192944 RepID=UPI000B9A5ECB|nr:MULTISPECIES: PLP-dependent aminotransferase family protein [unclassified Rhodococcus (in: high G+C Gram-positive bacteria)]OZE10296.1 aspartate aminotransferase [Rhodococcus sp. 05-2255-3C]OZE16487.1 aspartate aminotransferase [Rhodococcus sp. 05-2255-2A2]OZE16556.1 aspartate aminotransferase [Rhodococcus sp. 05-2255-3B1]
MSSTYLPAGLARRTDSLTSSAIRDLLSLTARDDVISLAGGLPATDLIPVDRIAAAAEAALRRPDAVQYCETSGHRTLRSVIAARESAVRGGVPVPVESVIVTHGSQQALTLLAQALIDPGAVVVVDEPAYTGALQVFSIAEASIESIPLTDTGMDTDELERRLTAGLRPAVVHTVANFHNPRGVTMSEQRRRHLAALADHYGFWVIEDDPYGEIWFGTTESGVDAPPAPIARHSDRVIRLSSASKILAPTLRVGWFVAPPSVCAAVELLKQGADLCGSSLTQSMTAEMLADSAWLDAHLTVLRREYACRATALIAALAAQFGDRLVVSRPAGGMFAWATFLDGTDTGQLLDAALEHGVAFVPGTAFASGAQYRHSLRLSYAGSTPPVLADAVQRLAAAHSAGSAA